MSISVKTKLSYGFGSFGKEFAIDIVYLYGLFYYTDVVGVSPAIIGIIFLFARVWDSINDPIMGWIVNNTKSRWGQFKPWILVGTITNSIVLFLMFSAHLIPENYVMAYVAITYILWGMTYTLMDIPFWSLVPTLTINQRERERLVPFPRFGASLAYITSAAITLKFVAVVGGEDKGFGFQMFTLLIILIFVASSLLVLRNVKEKYSMSTRKKQPKKPQPSIGQLLSLIYKNEQLFTVLCMGMSFKIATNVIIGFAIYYFTYVVGDADLFPVFIAYAGIAQLITMVLFSRLVQIFSRQVLWAASAILPIMGCLLLIYIGTFSQPNVWLIGFAGVLLNIGMAMFFALQIIMIADTVDYGEYKLGIRSESISYSVQTMVSKAGSAFAGFIIGILLSVSQYVPQTDQADETIYTMKWIMIGVPSVFFAIALIIYFLFYKLNGKMLEKVSASIEKAHSY